MYNPAESNNPDDAAKEHFDKISANYERLTGGCTRDVARHLLSLGPPITSTSTILDNGCGSGVVTDEIFKSQAPTALPATIHAVDVSPGMVQLTQAKAERGGWQNVKTGVMGAEELTFPDNTFSHSFSNFVVFFAPDAVKATSQIHRTLKPGGTALITAWDHLGFLPPALKVQKDIRPDLPPFKMPIPDEWFTASHFEKVLSSAGFEKISMTQKQTAMREADLDGLAGIISEFLIKITESWTDAEKEQWRPKLREALHNDPDLLRGDSGEVAVPMLANVAVVVK
ncbi:MAG: hypothetical protein M1837_004332 [Sclerophora amabilis]|nr:MAG: hypothetical protein M1837_004332 [Sclerophora amabilis]